MVFLTLLWKQKRLIVSCLSFTIVEKRHHKQDKIYKARHLIWWLSFRRLSHQYHGRKQGSIQADMVLGKELNVMHLDLTVPEETNTSSMGKG